SDEVGEHRERRAVLYQEGADGPGGGDEDRGADDGPEPRADGDRRAGTETDLWGFGLRREEQFDPFGSVAGHPLRLGLLDSPLPHVVLDGAFEQRPEMLQDQVALPRVETVELLDDAVGISGLRRADQAQDGPQPRGPLVVAIQPVYAPADRGEVVEFF